MEATMEEDPADERLLQILHASTTASPKRKPHVYDPSFLLRHNPAEAAEFREWICGSPQVFINGTASWSTTTTMTGKRPGAGGVRVDLVRDVVPKEDVADSTLLAQQEALSRRMAIFVTEGEE
jgi:hypothetical protein